MATSGLELRDEATRLAELVIPKLTVEGDITSEEFRSEVQGALMCALDDATVAGNSEMVTTAVNEVIGGEATIDFDVFIGTIIAKTAKMKLAMQAQGNGIDGIMNFMEELGIVHFRNAAGMIKWANWVRLFKNVIANGPECGKALEKLLREQVDSPDSFVTVLSENLGPFLADWIKMNEQNRPADYADEPTNANLKKLAADDSLLEEDKV